MNFLDVPAIEQPKIRKKIAHTKEELDLLFAAIEDVAARHGAIDFRTAGLILRPGDIVWIGPGVSIAYEMLFEIQGMRWLYEGERYRAFISPRTRSGRLPGIEWYVPITMCETGKYHGATWNRTDMLRPENRWYGDETADNSTSNKLQNTEELKARLRTVNDSYASFFQQSLAMWKRRNRDTMPSSHTWIRTQTQGHPISLTLFRSSQTSTKIPP